MNEFILGDARVPSPSQVRRAVVKVMQQIDDVQRHCGGAMPVESDVLVQVRLRNGQVFTDYARTLKWQHNVRGANPWHEIVAWRRVDLPPRDDPWIQYSGAERPVPEHAVVEVKFRNGTSVTCMARYLPWEHTGKSDDIVAYQVLDDRVNRTGWYDGTVAPLRSGVYELRPVGRDKHCFAYFDAAFRNWSYQYISSDRAAAMKGAYAARNQPSLKVHPYERTDVWFEWRGVRDYRTWI